VNVTGTSFVIPAVGEKDLASEIVAGSTIRQLDSILVSSKALASAITDWNGMVSRRAIKQNQTERAAGYRNIRFHSGPRDEIWEALKRNVGKAKVEKGKGKRSMEADGDEEGPSKKSKVDALPYNVLDY
jgi:hypothetical protein